MSLAELSNLDLHTQTIQVTKAERETTRKVLLHLKEIRRRRVYAEQGYHSLWEYAVKELGYDGAAATRRVAAVDLMFQTKEAQNQIEKGHLSLNRALQIQRFFRDHKLLTEQKVQLLKNVRGKSATETREKLQAYTHKKIPQNTLLQVEADPELLQLMKRAQELRGPMSRAELFKLGLKSFLKKNDPLLQARKDFTAKLEHKNQMKNRSLEKTIRLTKPLTQNTSRYIPQEIRKRVALRSGGRCEYTSPGTHRRCSSRNRLEYEHIIPYSQGGKSNDLENILHYCRSHNQLTAIQRIGQEKMDPYLNKKGR